MHVKSLLTSQVARYVGVGLVGLMIGGSVASGEPQTKTVTVTKEVPVVRTTTKTVEKTPEACKAALRIDNELFGTIAEDLQTFNFSHMADKIEAVTPERTAQYHACVEA